MNVESLRNKFFADPEWKDIEKVVMGYLEPLLDIETIDMSQPAEHVKAELIGRKMAYDSMYKFLEMAKILPPQEQKPPRKNPFE